MAAAWLAFPQLEGADAGHVATCQTCRQIYGRMHVFVRTRLCRPGRIACPSRALMCEVAEQTLRCSCAGGRRGGTGRGGVAAVTLHSPHHPGHRLEQ